jgi:hypothetical protein
MLVITNCLLRKKRCVLLILTTMLSQCLSSIIYGNNTVIACMDVWNGT